MKNLIKTTVFALLLTLSFNAQAAKDFEVEISQNQVLKIDIENLYAKHTLRLLDAKGGILFEAMNLTSAYHKQLSLKNLPTGTYYLSLENDNIIMSKKISKNSRIVAVVDSNVMFKPDFKQLDSNKRRVKVAYTNITHSKTNLKVYDKDWNLIMTLANNDQFFNKTLDFSEVPSGKYSVAISNNGKSYQKNIIIE